MERLEKAYLIREGHLFGFVLGVLLARLAPWLVVVWGLIVLVLWISSFKAVTRRDADAPDT